MIEEISVIQLFCVIDQKYELFLTSIWGMYKLHDWLWCQEINVGLFDQTIRYKSDAGFNSTTPRIWQEQGCKYVQYIEKKNIHCWRYGSQGGSLFSTGIEFDSQDRSSSLQNSVAGERTLIQCVELRCWGNELHCWGTNFKSVSWTWFLCEKVSLRGFRSPSSN